MDKAEFFITPGYGELLNQRLGYSQAVKVGNRVEISGQGGWTDDLQFPDNLVDEIELAFKNVERVLAAAGATWENVIEVMSYHVGGFPPETNETFARLFRQYMPNRGPIWTEVGVAALGDPHMRVEIRVTAIIE